MIKDAHNALHDVQSSGRAKELLAQVSVRFCLKEVTWGKVKKKVPCRESVIKIVNITRKYCSTAVI